MVHQTVRNAIANGRKFASEVELTKYLNRIIPHCVRKGVKAKTAKLHAGHVKYLYRKGQLNPVISAG